MSHIRTQIRNNITAAIKNTGLFKEITEDRQYFIANEEYPAALIITEEEAIEPATKQRCGPAPQKRLINNAVYILHQVNENLQDALDSLAIAVEAAILADTTLQGAALQTILEGMSSDFSGDKVEAPTGATRLSFISTVHTVRTNPQTGLQQL